MNLSDLQQFCGSGDDYPDLAEPFSHEGQTYATDGALLIRVPRMAEVSKPCPKLLLSHLPGLLGENYDGQWIAIPVLPAPSTLTCPNCNGSGKVYPCPECEGERSVKYVGKTADWGIECPLCKGYGHVDDGETAMECGNCQGSGCKETNLLANKKVGEVRVENRLLRKIATLPDVELFAPRKSGVNEVFFRFTGGVGVVMVLREYIDTDEG